jgi:hypothetical protein
MTDEQFQELMSELRALAMKIRFIEEDIQEIKDLKLEQIKACVEQLATEHLQRVQDNAAKNWKVERL